MSLVLPLDSFVLPYVQYVYLAIGIGMLVGLIFSETLGVMGGGLIVPGYFALHLQPESTTFPQSLSRHLQEPKTTNSSNLNSCSIFSTPFL